MQMLALLALLSGLMADGSEGFGPYKVNPDLTTGRMEFFREVYVDADQIGNLIKPSQPLPAASAATGDLRIHNSATGWVVVSIGDLKIGKVGPLTTAVIHQVPSGFYDITTASANGFKVTQKLSTTVAGESPISRDPSVKPPQLPQGEAPPSP